MTESFSDFLVFVDESGDHGLASIDPGFPLFVLAFCIIRKSDYVERIVPAMQRFKFKHFGHDNVVLHEREIRYNNERLPFRIQFADKRANLPGLQLADLVARPVGLHELRPTQLNRAYDIIKTKFYRSTASKIRGWGLKCFP